MRTDIHHTPISCHAVRRPAGPLCLATALAIALALMLAAAGNAAAEAFTAGEHYSEISPPVDTTAADGKTEVVELFWYGCPHCYSFEPHLEAWLEEKPESVEFKRIPAVYNKRWAFHARAFYTAEALGVLDRIHKPLFEAIHRQRNPMAQVSDIAALFAAHAGVDEATFLETFKSFAVDSQVRKAAKLTRDYGITGVPSLVIDGRHRTTARQAGGHEEMLKVAEHLADN